MPEIRIVTVTLNPAVDRVLEAPNFAIGEHVAARRLAWYPAGKGINVARALAKIGVGSVATGFVGRGELGMFEEALERTGPGQIVTQLLIVRGRSRDNITVVDPINDTETHLREEGFKVQPEDVARIGSKLAMMARPGRIIAFSGSLPPGFSPEAFADIVRRCHRAGAKVAVDTSNKALAAIRDQPLWMAKLNKSELQTLAGSPSADLNQAAHAALGLSVRGGGLIENVVATRGADGAVLVGPEAAVRGWVSVHPGRIVSSVGCGDSLLAGILSVISRDEHAWERAFREGLAMATTNACGREAAHVDLEEVAEFRDQASMESLDLPPMAVSGV